MTNDSKIEKNRKPGKAKGSPKTGGRQKGTPNKNTSIIKLALDQEDFVIMREFKKVYEQLPTEQKLAELKFLMRFVYKQLPESGEPAELEEGAEPKPALSKAKIIEIARGAG